MWKYLPCLVPSASETGYSRSTATCFFLLGFAYVQFLPLVWHVGKKVLRYFGWTTVLPPRDMLRLVSILRRVQRGLRSLCLLRTHIFLKRLGMLWGVHMGGRVEKEAAQLPEQEKAAGFKQVAALLQVSQVAAIRCTWWAGKYPKLQPRNFLPGWGCRPWYLPGCEGNSWVRAEGSMSPRCSSVGGAFIFVGAHQDIDQFSVRRAPNAAVISMDNVLKSPLAPSRTMPC